MVVMRILGGPTWSTYSSSDDVGHQYLNFDVPSLISPCDPRNKFASTVLAWGVGKNNASNLLKKPEEGNKRIKNHKTKREETLLL
jgi:hypothetical protein